MILLKQMRYKWEIWTFKIKVALIGILLLLTSFVCCAQQNILIYAGPGVGPKSLANTVELLQSLVADTYIIKTVGPDTLINTAWLIDTALLIMPGGADLPYMEQLHGIGNNNIRDYVQKGGKFLGICAGAYYAADRIEFAKGDARLEVTGERDLKFFPGVVQGPTYSGFDYLSPQNIAGMRAATIFWQAGYPFAKDQNISVYYNGGGHFLDATNYSDITILAYYAPEISQDINRVAIVECNVGKGLAILSGIHFEWGPEALVESEPRIMAIKSKINANNQTRLLLAQHLLQRLGIN